MSMGKHHEKRKTKRHQFEAPLFFEAGEGTTKDFSLSGVYFTTRQSFRAGDFFKFTIDLAHAIPGRNVPLECDGYVLRVDEHKKQIGVAVRIQGVAYHH